MGTLTPNFFIVGVAKCGTTALATYLGDHESIFFSVPKEPNYWSSDIPQARWSDIDTLERYLELFETTRKTEYRAIGEGSANYIRSKVAIRRILEFNPESRFIVMLRNPVEVVHAVHMMHYLALNENVENFEEAWRLQETRNQGFSVPKNCVDPSLLRYSEYALFYPQINRLIGLVPEKQRKIIIFDDFVSDTKAVYRDVLEFLGIKDDGRESFPVVNEARIHRFPMLTRLTRTPPTLIQPFTRKLRQKLVKLRRYGILNKMVSKNRPRTQLEEEIVLELKNYFRRDINDLSDLLGRDLSHWVASL